MTRHLLLCAVAAAVACGIEPVEPESVVPMALVAVIEAGDSVHEAELHGFGRPLLDVGSRLEVVRAGEVQVRAGVADNPPCVRRGGGAYVGAVACQRYVLAVSPGDSVGIEAWAPGFDSVSGRTQVPGTFAVTRTEAASASGAWLISWTPSADAASYLVELRDWTECDSPSPCPVLQTIRTTEHSIALPQMRTDGNARINVAVSALDVHLDAFVTTGVPGEAFSRLPISSVSGGIGVVGSLTRGTPSYLYLDSLPQLGG